MNKSFYLSFTLVFLLFACSTANVQQSNSLLSGQLKNLSEQELYLIDLSSQQQIPVDTAKVDENGNFSFDYQPTQIGFYRVNFSNGAALILPLKSGDAVSLNGDVNDNKSIVVKGSEEAVRLSEFNIKLMDIMAAQASLNEEFQQIANEFNVDSLTPIFRARYENLEIGKIQLMKNMLNEAPNSFSNLAIIEQLPPEMDDHISYYINLDKALANDHQNSPFYQNFHAKVVELSKFSPGSSVPEINLPSPEGPNIALSSLRGKVVLIDFWASWCKPCRFENPNVVAAYQKFKDKGFTVYGVSLDRTKDAWVKAIEQDQLTWTHVSDLKFWGSIAAKDYGVTGIPFAVLIDREGKVIGKNLRGAALHQKLEEVLN